MPLREIVEACVGVLVVQLFQAGVWAGLDAAAGRYAEVKDAPGPVERVLREQDEGRPPDDRALALEVLREEFGVRVAAAALRGLPSYIDRNYAAEREGGAVVLKVANAATTEAEIDFELEVVRRLAAAGVPVPPAVECRGGGLVARGRWRCSEFVPGRALKDAMPVDAAALERYGALVGRADRATAAIEHAADRRALPWNLDHAAETLRVCAPFVRDPRRRGFVETVLRRLEGEWAPLLAGLPECVVHGDMNPGNLLADDGGGVVCVLDVGDAGRMRRVNSAAVALADTVYWYPDRPVRSAEHFVAGYCRELRLGEDELRLVLPLVVVRMSVSVSMSAREASERPGNEHTAIDMSRKWLLISAFARTGAVGGGPAGAAAAEADAIVRAGAGR